ncbi:MAG: Sec-independent protein translocase protein TatB [Pseudomonadota bacterium]
MFDIGWTEMLMVAVVAILVVGPKELPGMLRGFGRTMGNLRRMASEFQGQFNDALREAEQQAGLDEARKSVSGLNDLNPVKNLKDAVNPLKDVERDISDAMKTPPAEATPTKPASASPSTEAAPNDEPAAPEPAAPASSGSDTPEAGTDAGAPPEEPVKAAKAGGA